MTLYLNPSSAAASWMEPIETVYQSLSCGRGSRLTPKLPHLTDWDALFLSGLVQMPRESRPHGIITWASEAFRLSRTSLYALHKRVEAKLFGEEVEPSAAGAMPSRASLLKPAEMVDVTEQRLQRTILRATFPGNVSIRPTQQIVADALDVRPSIGYISELRVEAGRKARHFVRGLDYSNIGRVIVGRDETFFHGRPILLVVEPVSMTILLAEVCADRQADTWGAALQIAQEQGATIKGLVEDMARNYEKSQKLANLADVAVQKDTWHLLRDSAQLLTKLEKAAYRTMQRVIDLEKRLNKAWSEKDFAAYLRALAAEAEAIAHYDAYRPLHRHFCDALELVDRRSGELRDPQTAAWFLDAILDEMTDCTNTHVLRFCKTLRNQRRHLLTFIDWLQQDLPAWRQQLSAMLPDPNAALTFERLVAQQWWYKQKCIAGERRWQSVADDVALMLDEAIAECNDLSTLASDLHHLLDAAGHTNSVTESLNGLLKSFLNARQHFHSTDTMQAYLDLFVLWHNTRIFARGKRQGYSPFQLAGVETDSDDWITLLRY